MNLLPQQEIKIIKRETSMRLIIVVCFLFAIFEAVAILLIIPSYVFVKAERDTLSMSVDQIKHSIIGKGSVDDEMKIVGQDIKEFINNENINEKKTTEIINTALKLRPAGINTNSISVIGDDSGRVLQMTGMGKTREDLIEYQKVLSTLDFVKEAHYTEKFIIKKSDINYNLIVILK